MNNWYKKSRRKTDAEAIGELIVFRPNVPVVFQFHRIASSILDKFLHIDFPSSFDNDSLNKTIIVNDIASMMGKHFKGRQVPLEDLPERIAKYVDNIAYLISIELRS